MPRLILFAVSPTVRHLVNGPHYEILCRTPGDRTVVTHEQLAESASRRPLCSRCKAELDRLIADAAAQLPGDPDPGQ